MEKPPQSFDVCIVCALPEEARAFLKVVQQQCKVAFEKHISTQYKYDYQLTTIKNDKGEPLNLHVSWLPRYGPQEMTLHLSRVLEECQPRIAIMTGICAGDAQRVQLGDLVVAERTFAYDNGKFTLDEHGRKVHLHDTLTYQLDANILQFLGLFDEWKPLVARLQRPPSPSEQHKKRKIACHIKAMASGSAVRADNPFEDVRAPVRGTVAIDMEGAAFGLVMSRHPLIPWLVIKGVCDYADRGKNDSVHDYAARASALYALSFIRAYVTHERLPRPNGSSFSSGARPSGVWNVPHARNPHFTGRDELLDRLHQQLTPTEQNDPARFRRIALTQPQAIKGLGGVGKTQIAVEYAYRSREQGRFTHILWVNAASEETIIASFVTIAELLPTFSAKNETDQRKLVEAVKRWLEQCEQRWLLIFDNADDLPIIQEHVPQSGNGSVLLTTRTNAVGSLGASSIEVENMGLIEGTEFLLHRVQRQQASDEERDEAINVVIALDCFPLALDQAGAYIEETGCGFIEYLKVYENHRKELLARRGEQATNYPSSVAITWSLSFKKVNQANPAAAELLRLCAFLAPDKIPEELIQDGAANWSPLLQQAATDLFTFNQMVEELLKFSLVKRLVETRMLSIHRLVQAVQMDTMEPTEQRQWAERVVRAVNDVFPSNSDDVAAIWPQCLRYLSQVQVCYDLVGLYTLMLIEAARLLNRTSIYLWHQALYTIAEPLIQRALLIYEQQLGPDHPNTASSLHNLADLYRSQGKYAEAEPLYQRALSICEQQMGTEHPTTAVMLNSLANLYEIQGKYAEAELLCQRALTIHEQQFGPDHLGITISLSSLANLYESQGKYAEAELLHQRALLICEQQLRPLHPQMASHMDNLARLYEKRSKYEEAELLHQRALTIRKQQLGPDHPDTATSLNNLAALYWKLGKYAEAEPLYRRTLAIDIQTFGADHPEVATDLNNLANLYKRQGKYVEAEPLYQRALSIYEQQLGRDHLDTQTVRENYATLLRALGRDGATKELEERS
jgi:tetratricopeptide (TPR) repeat protein/nucleoside phosphorylase